MKKFEFDRTNQQWDRFGQFYVKKHGDPFYEFDNGSLMIDYARPQDRRVYPKYGIEIATTRYCAEQFYFDKECTQPVTPAWLVENGTQDIAIDHEQKVAVYLGYRRERGNVPTPSNLGRPRAYWARPGVLPLTCGPIHVSQPDKDARKEWGSLLREVREIITAAVRVRGLRRYVGSTKCNAKRLLVEGATAESVAHQLMRSEHDMCTVAENGFWFPRVETEHEYLYVK